MVTLSATAASFGTHSLNRTPGTLVGIALNEIFSLVQGLIDFI